MLWKVVFLPLHKPCFATNDSLLVTGFPVLYQSPFCHLWGTPELLGLESLHLLLFITHLSQSPGVGCAFPAFSSWACFWTTHWYLRLPCHFIMEPCHSDWLAHEFGSVPLELLNPYCGCSPGPAFWAILQHGPLLPTTHTSQPLQRQV